MINLHYHNRYTKLIEYRKDNPLSENVYGEIHHILPKCMGGTDDEDNLIRLSGREHFIAHFLLAKSYPKESKLWYAFNMMSRICDGKSVLYEAARKYISQNLSNDAERKRKISDSLKNRSFSDEHRRNISEAMKKRTGWNHSDDTKKKMSENGIKGSKMYHNPITMENVYIKDGQDIPDGHILGAGPKYLKAVHNRKQRMKWYHDPKTKKNIRIGENEDVPEGFVKGRYVEKVECCGRMWDPGNLAQHRRKTNCQKKQ